MTQNTNSDQNAASQIDDRMMQNLRQRLQQQGDHMQVKDVNGEYVGTVDGLEGDRLKLTKSGSHDGQHHYVQLSQVKSMDNEAVYLNVPHSSVQ